MLIELSDHSEGKGSGKSCSGAFRTVSQFVDLIPADLAPGAGTLLSEASAGTIAGVAAAIDTGAKVIEGDIGGAGEELARGVGDVAGAVIPFAEWARAAGIIDLREEFANAAGATYNTAFSRTSTVKQQVAPTLAL